MIIYTVTTYRIVYESEVGTTITRAVQGIITIHYRI